MPGCSCRHARIGPALVSAWRSREPHPARSRVTALSAASLLDRGGQQAGHDNAKPRQCTSAGRWWTAGKIGESLPRPIARHNPGLAEAILRRSVVCSVPMTCTVRLFLPAVPASPGLAGLFLAPISERAESTPNVVGRVRSRQRRSFLGQSVKAGFLGWCSSQLRSVRCQRCVRMKFSRSVRSG